MTEETPRKTAAKSTKARAVTKSVEPENVSTVSSWLGVKPEVLDNPDFAMTKEIIYVYAKRLTNQDEPEQLKAELLSVFDNPVGKHALALATNTAVDSATIAATVGEAAGQQTRKDMKLAFNAAFSRALMTPDEYEIPLEEKISLAKHQLTNALDALKIPTSEPPKQIPSENP